MKRCPQCQADYFDNMLEFCLEDGTRLAAVGAPTAVGSKPSGNSQDSVETVFFAARGGEIPPTIETSAPLETAEQQRVETKTDLLKQKAAEKGYRALELLTLVCALAHNWWQWLYVDKQAHSSVSGFLFSAEFLIWFLLLAVGSGLGLLSLKFSRAKGLAYAGLVILAINFLLLLVPRK